MVHFLRKPYQIDIYIVCYAPWHFHTNFWNRLKIKNWNSKHQAKLDPWTMLSTNRVVVISKFSTTKTTLSRLEGSRRRQAATSSPDRRWGLKNQMCWAFLFHLFLFCFRFSCRGEGLHFQVLITTSSFNIVHFFFVSAWIFVHILLNNFKMA